MKGAVSASAMVSRRDRDGLSRGQPERERVRPLRLDRDDPDSCGNTRGRDPGDETASAAGDDDGVDLRNVLEDLEPDGPGTRDHDGIVERVHEHAPRLLLELAQPLERLPRPGRLEVDGGPVAARGLDLRGARAPPHDDERVGPSTGGRPRHRLGVISRRHGDHAARALVRRERADAVERAARLEGAGLLEQLGLQVPAGAEALGAEGRRAVHGAPDDPCRAADVVGRDGRLGHRAILLKGRFGDDVAVPDEPVTPRPVRLVVTDDLERSRVTVFFRLLLAIPHLVVVALWGVAAVAVAVVLWLALLFEGRAPKSLQGFVVSYVRYSVQVSAYLHLAASPWPRFGGSDGYPVDVEIEPARRQSRGRVAARLVLAVPVLLLATVVGGAAFVGPWDGGSSGGDDSTWVAVGSVGGGLAATAAFLAWFASLARGRTPRGLRDLAAYGIAYAAQVAGYLLLLTDRYPTSESRARAAAGLASPSSRPARARRRAEAIAP